MGGIAQDAGLAALFSNLRRLRRPSEDSAIPDKGEIGRRHGSHTWLRIPGEGVSLILAQRVVYFHHPRIVNGLFVKTVLALKSDDIIASDIHLNDSPSATERSVS